MLVLTRKNQQSIQIGDIVITVISTSHGRAKIGITAPENIRVQRSELINRELASERPLASGGCQSTESLEVTLPASA